MREEGAVFSVTLKRVRYADGHLQWNTCKIRTLRAGVVERLVEHLAPYREEVDVSYRTCFLCTYRTFTSAATVLRLLRERYVEPVSVCFECGILLHDCVLVVCIVRGP